jgi:two-component system, LytTR family, response regulator
MNVQPLRVVLADDERPARRFLINLLNACDGVQVVGEAASGKEALAMIGSKGPDLALLDLQMPELGGLEVARRLEPARLPLVAFVTAFDDFAVEAFELNAIDYLLKPVEQDRLHATLTRARARLSQPELVDERPEDRAAALVRAATIYDDARQRPYLERIPVRRRADVIILPVRQIASVVAEGELLHIMTTAKERFTITHRLHALESRLDPRRFVRLARGTLANVESITRITPMPGGTYLATLSNGQELQVSRIQSRQLRDTLLKL